MVYLTLVLGLAKIANLYLSHFFKFCFSLNVRGSYHKHEILLQSLWMPWNLSCWCILTTSELIRFLIIICWFFWFWRHLDIMKQAQFGTHMRNGLNFGTLIYPDHLQNLLNFVRGLLIFLFWLHFDFVKQVIFGVFGNFLQNAWEEWLGIWHADVDYLFNCLHFGHGLDFYHLGGNLTKWNKSNLQFSGIFLGIHRRNWLN